LPTGKKKRCLPPGDHRRRVRLSIAGGPGLPRGGRGSPSLQKTTRAACRCVGTGRSCSVSFVESCSYSTGPGPKRQPFRARGNHPGQTHGASDGTLAGRLTSRRGRAAGPLPRHPKKRGSLIRTTYSASKHSPGGALPWPGQGLRRAWIPRLRGPGKLPLTLDLRTGGHRLIIGRDSRRPFG